LNFLRLEWRKVVELASGGYECSIFRTYWKQLLQMGSRSRFLSDCIIFECTIGEYFQNWPKHAKKRSNINFVTVFINLTSKISSNPSHSCQFTNQSHSNHFQKLQFQLKPTKIKHHWLFIILTRIIILILVFSKSISRIRSS